MHPAAKDRTMGMTEVKMTVNPAPRTPPMGSTRPVREAMRKQWSGEYPWDRSGSATAVPSRMF